MDSYKLQCGVWLARGLLDWDAANSFFRTLTDYKPLLPAEWRANRNLSNWLLTEAYDRNKELTLGGIDSHFFTAQARMSLIYRFYRLEEQEELYIHLLRKNFRIAP